MDCYIWLALADAFREDMLSVIVLESSTGIMPMQNIMKRGILMTYKTIVIDYAPKAKKMAAAIEKTANEKAQNGWELVTFSVTNSAKAILVFRVPEDAPQEKLTEEEIELQEETAEAVGEAE